MRTILNTDDFRVLFNDIFNGGGNKQDMTVVDEYGDSETIDVATFLNVKFYAWKQRLVSKGEEDNPVQDYAEWLQSLNGSLNEAYALIELTDEETVASQDIDSTTKDGKVTFVIQTNKVNALESYVNYLRNKYIGTLQEHVNGYGETIKAFLTIGMLLYDEPPRQTQLGETIQVSFNFRFAYMQSAQAFSDTKVEISLDGETNYLEMPITKLTWQNVFSTSPVPTYGRPDITGSIATSLSTAKTLTFFDYNKPLTQAFNDLFWSMSAIKINGADTTVKSVNIPVYIRITNGGKTYVYKDVIEQMEKSMSNNDFNICSITLKGYGKGA